MTAHVHELIEEQAARNPQRLALTVGDRHLTYGELQRRVELASQQLVAAGARPDVLVGVPTQRTVETVVAILGILSSGAAYVPFHQMPKARLDEIRERASLRVFAGGSSALAELGPHVGAMISTDNENLVPPETPSHDAQRRPRADNLAYVIFTSGSTGTPKGVMTSHRALTHSTTARYDVFPLPAEGYLMLAPFGFDAAVAGIFFTLSTGGRLVVPTEEEVLDPGLLAELVVRESVTHVDGVPSQYSALLRFHADAMVGLRGVVVAGEALSSDLVRQHLTSLPKTPLFNEYGPTEGTVWSTVHRFDEGHELDQSIPLAPLGRAVGRTRVTVEFPNGAGGDTSTDGVGEIVISGPGLARGYLADPAQTAARFLPDPYGDGNRVYYTGDLGEWRDGLLHFRGRRDRMVKIRGFRVELDEVEATLACCPDLHSAAVIPMPSSTGAKLVAFVVLKSPSVSARDLVEWLSSTLPPFMTPHIWRRLETLPLTHHGKIDRAALGALSAQGHPISGTPLH